MSAKFNKASTAGDLPLFGVSNLGNGNETTPIVKRVTMDLPQPSKTPMSGSAQKNNFTPSATGSPVTMGNIKKNTNNNSQAKSTETHFHNKSRASIFCGSSKSSDSDSDGFVLQASFESQMDDYMIPET